MIQRALSDAKEAITSATLSGLPIRFKGLHSKRESAPGLSLDAMIQPVNLSSRWELLCYFIYPLGIELNMPPNLHNSRKRMLV